MPATVGGRDARLLADTGAAATFVSRAFVDRHGLVEEPLGKPTSVEDVHGNKSLVTTMTTQTLRIGEARLGSLPLLVADIAGFDVVLGFPMLQSLSPRVDWRQGTLEFTKGLSRGERRRAKHNGRERATPRKRGRRSHSRAERSLDGPSSLSAAEERSESAGTPLSAPPIRPVPHRHEFVSAEQLVQAASQDGPIGMMWLDVDWPTLRACGFVETGDGSEEEPEPPDIAGIPAEYRDFADVFSEKEADRLPPHGERDLKIELEEGAKPPQGPLYPKGPRELQELRRYLDEMLGKGFIRPSRSPARSPVLYVPKKDGSLRLCVDYRGLNKITVKNRTPLPLIDEMLGLLRRAKVYTKLDLRAAYNLIRIAAGDEWKTAFGTDFGLFEYLVMPFGLANAPGHFQTVVNTIFRDILGVYVVIYLDDFFIFSDNPADHTKHVREVLRRLREHRLFCKLSKCQFNTTEADFLGYIVTPTGLSMEAEKTKAIAEWPEPRSIHDIQVFLGFANYYRRFIRHYSRIARPLTDLVKPVQRFRKFELPEAAKAAFENLKKAFSSAPILRHFDYDLPTRVETDASDNAIAGILKQEHDGLWHPVAFYSRKMTSAEANYEIHDKELLAVVASLRHWYQFLAGLPSRFGVLTDHDALKYFATQRWISRRQARWALHLADFDFEIVYRPGKLGGEPDALTRRSDMTSKEGDDADANYRTVLSPSLFVGAVSTRRAKARASLDDVLQLASRSTLADLCKAYQPLDPWLKTQLASVKRREGLAQKADGLWYVHDRLVVPEIPSRGRGVSAAQDSSPRNVEVEATTRRGDISPPESSAQPASPGHDPRSTTGLSREHLRYMVMTQVHDSQPAGHPGRDATLEHAQRLYYWPNMKSWVADYVASCDACARTKRPRHRPYGYLQPLKTPDRPWGSISADFIEGLPLSEGYDSILVVVDRLTKTAVMVPTTKDVTSAQTAALFEKHVFARFGLPDDVTTDRGRQFISEAWRTFAQKHGFAHNLSTAYHPQTDGQTERVNQVLEQYLRLYCSDEQDNWVDLLPTASFAYNNTVHATLGLSPFFACHGWHPKAHGEAAHAGVLDPSTSSFAPQDGTLLRHCQDRIREAQARSVRNYNNKHQDQQFQPGDLVWVSNRNWKTHRPSKKLGNSMSGPFKVLERIGRVAYRLKLLPHMRVHDVFHVSMLEPYRRSGLDRRKDEEVEQVVEGADYYEVETILDHRGSRSRQEYLVLWRGYPEEEASWVKAKDLNADERVAEYWARQQASRGL
ncbi:related to Gag-pol polyprotein [Pseudozyma flocculosa]|uniref:RNA-directed DNA polymerase n=1 Tax=Pseudozyma flocculosa TaxID=84751 RepID=A0A5C3FCP6_9BASI|nr:related to Gag-pol polyprotein [Pseudozyma flocculosa]